MEFFIPHASDAAEAESVLKSIAEFVRCPVPPPDRRIFRMSYTHNGKPFAVEVGQAIPSYYREGDQPVIAILAGNPYCVCLPNRGVVRGNPIFVGETSITSIEYFRSTPPA